MAVYTKITQQDIDHLFQDYNGIEQIKGIAEGVENTNYLVNTKNQNKFIFTIFEKRTKRSDLPFFHKAMSEFNHKGIACPTPITVNENDIFNIKEVGVESVFLKIKFLCLGVSVQIQNYLWKFLIWKQKRV